MPDTRGRWAPCRATKVRAQRTVHPSRGTIFPRFDWVPMVMVRSAPSAYDRAGPNGTRPDRRPAKGWGRAMGDGNAGEGTGTRTRALEPMGERDQDKTPTCYRIRRVVKPTRKQPSRLLYMPPVWT